MYDTATLDFAVPAISKGYKSFVFKVCMSEKMAYYGTETLKVNYDFSDIREPFTEWLRIPRRRWENNIKTDLSVVEWGHELD
jgi:hypothetical protein